MTLTLPELLEAIAVRHERLAGEHLTTHEAAKQLAWILQDDPKLKALVLAGPKFLMLSPDQQARRIRGRMPLSTCAFAIEETAETL